MTMTTRLIRAAVVGAVAAPLALAGTAFAQGQASDPTQDQLQETNPVAPAQDEVQAEVTDAELQTYVAATVKLQQVNDKWQQRYQQTDDDQERVDLQQQAQAEMVKTVENEGLSVGQYNSISQAVQSDPELQARATTYMQERMQKRSG